MQPRKLSLKEWAIEKGIHYNTAKIRFDKWLIEWSRRDEFNKMYIYEYKTQEEIDLEIYNEMYADKIRKAALLKKEINDYNNGIIPSSTTIHTEQKSDTTTTKSPKEKKKDREIIPSTLEWEELEKENKARCIELVVDFTRCMRLLAQTYNYSHGNMSRYLDMYEQSKRKLTFTAFINILNAEWDADLAYMQKMWLLKSDDEQTTLQSEPIKKEETIEDKIENLAGKKNLDLDLYRYWFENTECPQLQGNDVLLDFLQQYPKKDFETYASEVVIANRETNEEHPSPRII